MNISLEWITDFLPGPRLDPRQAADVLTAGGLLTEHITPFGDDAVLDVEVGSNRSDCLSHLGIARELSALMRRSLRDPASQSAPIASGDPGTSVTIEAAELCPHYVARVIRGVRVGPSPIWMVRRLEAVGLRPINNVVDVTNYVMFELGQPLHAFDFDQLAGQRIVVRLARAGEKMRTIDGHERPLTPRMLVIADAQRPVALAGVMGGKETEVTEGTVNVLLESARFDPMTVRRTARALALHSASSYRFERGIDPLLPERASARAAQLIAEVASGTPAPAMATAGAARHEPRRIALRLGHLKRLLGVEVSESAAIDALTRLGLSPTRGQDDALRVVVPSHRLDLRIEADLIEEVARVIGYDRIPVREEIAIRLTAPEPEAKATELIRSTLVAAGFFEAVTFSFVADPLADAFMPAEAASLPRADAAVRKADARLRPSVLPGLLEAVRRNETAGTPGAKLFEIAATFWNDASGTLVEQRRIGLVGDGELPSLRGAIEVLLARLDPSRPIVVHPCSRAGFAPGATGRIEWGGQAIGHLGLCGRAVAQRLDLRTIPAMAELDFVPLLASAGRLRQLAPLPRFPAIRRDLSLIVEESTRYEAIESLVRAQSLPDLEAVEHVATYRGKPLEKGQKSVTIALVFRSPETTLTSARVEAAVSRLATAARDGLAATLRT